MNVRHAAGQNFIIGDAKTVEDYECSANKVVRYLPYEGATRVYHTNHPLVTDDIVSEEEMNSLLPNGLREKGIANSKIRLNSLTKRFENPTARITVDSIKSALCSKDDPENPLCMALDDDIAIEAFTSASMIYELCEEPLLNFAPGAPCCTEYKRYTF